MRTLVALLALVAVSGSQGVALDLPPELAGYRSWKALSPNPQRVSGKLSSLCRILTREEELAFEAAEARAQQSAEAREQSGPHITLFVNTYGNPVAFEALAGPGLFTFPPGTILAKAKFNDPDGKKLAGVAFMIKHPKNEFSESGGWEFQYFPRNADAKADYGHCIRCHRDGNTRDYVFSRLNAKEQAASW